MSGPGAGSTSSRRRRRVRAAVGAVGLLLAAFGLGLVLRYVSSLPDEGTDANGMFALSCGLMAVFCVGAAITLLVHGFRKPAEWQLRSAAWYPDPSGRGLRYWDGTSWTDHRP